MNRSYETVTDEDLLEIAGYVGISQERMNQLIGIFRMMDVTIQRPASPETEDEDDSLDRTGA